MRDLLLFVLPAGRSAGVDRPVARSICSRLWDQGLEPGAATAATLITEGLQRNVLFGTDLHFNERELAPLLDAARVHPRTWADLLQASNLSAHGLGRTPTSPHGLRRPDHGSHGSCRASQRGALLVDVRDLRDELA